MTGWSNMTLTSRQYEKKIDFVKDTHRKKYRWITHVHAASVVAKSKWQLKSGLLFNMPGILYF